MALKHLDYQKYLDELSLVEPIEAYLKIAQNSPNTINQLLEKYSR